VGKLNLYLAKTPEEVAALYEKLTGRTISVEKVRAALAEKQVKVLPKSPEK